MVWRDCEAIECGDVILDIGQRGVTAWYARVIRKLHIANMQVPAAGIIVKLARGRKAELLDRLRIQPAHTWIRQELLREVEFCSKWREGVQIRGK